MGMDRVTLHVVTPERTPLGLFGEEASASVAELLDAAGIELHRGVVAEIAPDGAIDLGFGEPLRVDRIVALPALVGPSLPGVPADAHGFIPVDDLGRVRGLDHVRAAGDATDQPDQAGRPGLPAGRRGRRGDRRRRRRRRGRRSADPRPARPPDHRRITTAS